jgi:hypothetical protein
LTASITDRTCYNTLSAKITVILVMKLCRSFWKKVAPPSSGHINSSMTLTEAAYSCETSANFYRSTPRHTRTRRRDNLKSHSYRFVVGVGWELGWGTSTLSLFPPEGSHTGRVVSPLVSDTAVLCSILGLHIVFMAVACNAGSRPVGL